MPDKLTSNMPGWSAWYVRLHFTLSRSTKRYFYISAFKIAQLFKKKTTEQSNPKNYWCNWNAISKQLQFENYDWVLV